MYTVLFKAKSDQPDESKNPAAPSIRPSDIIEKSVKTSGDWLTRDIEKKLSESTDNS